MAHTEIGLKTRSKQSYDAILVVTKRHQMAYTEIGLNTQSKQSNDAILGTL